MKEESKLTYQAKNHPFMGKYAFSGGFVKEQEDLNLAFVCRAKYRMKHYHTQSWSYWATHYCGNTLSGLASGLPLLHLHDIQWKRLPTMQCLRIWLDIAMVDGQLQLVDGDKTLSHDDLALTTGKSFDCYERIKEDSNTTQLFSNIMPEENSTTYRQLFGTLMRHT